MRKFALTVATRGHFCHPVSRTSARRKCTSLFLYPLLRVCPSVGRDCVVRLGCAGCGSSRDHIRRLELRKVTRTGHCTSSCQIGGTINAARLRGVMIICGKVRVEIYRRVMPLRRARGWECLWEGGGLRQLVDGRKAVVIMSSGGKILSTMGLLLGGRFRRVIALPSPVALPTTLHRRGTRIILLSVGFDDKLGAKGRNLC